MRDMKVGRNKKFESEETMRNQKKVGENTSRSNLERKKRAEK